MTDKQVNYQEGSCFVVPLRNGGFARGLVARMDGTGGIFGYFFGPKLSEIAEATIDVNWEPQISILSGQFGDLGLINGEWHVIGKSPHWSRDQWPMPPFARVDKKSGTAFITHYDENTLEFVREERVDAASVESRNLPEDVLMGYGAVEIRLTLLLDEPPH